MLISHQAKFIFVHVQKTGGKSFEALLQRHFPDLEHWHGRHGHARDGVAEIGLEKWRDYYSFAIVRNPWERLVSWYAMIDRYRRDLPLHKRWSRRPFSTEIWNQVVQKGRTFDEFIVNCTDVIWDKGCYKSFAFNQLDYLTDKDGALLVNDIGRFENMAEDAKRALEKIGVNETLPRKNASRHDHYSTWYNDKTRAIVEERFARDIAAFGYKFEERPATSTPIIAAAAGIRGAVALALTSLEGQMPVGL